jgi:NADH dehydrogenase (ubiquinone) 1 alpha subcomplex subunit 5
LLANVKPARYLEPHTPIGLTGLTTHPSPRPTLIHVYRQTLEKLKAFPETSVYRKSTEALTRHRLQIIESTKPPGFDAWFERAKETVAKHPEHFKNLKFAPDGTYTIAVEAESANSGASFPPKTPEEVAKYEEEAAQFVKGELPENPTFFKKVAQTEYDPVLESEPALEAEQIAEIENKIGAGLIEEVVVVANDEFKLVDTLAESQVWEELEEKPSPGQWTYFERGPEKS